ncbi:MAG: DegT/DnrJ/EryC1/StrS aminotransferase family protein [Chloroflexota bacterium]
MIPRVRPSYHPSDLWAALRAAQDDVRLFEHELAAYFKVHHAITFPYGRSAIYACLKALEPEGREVVQPAYNCVVVAHATVMAGYQPVFVDAQPQNPDQDPDEMIARVNQHTGMVIPTSIFGYAFDAVSVYEAIRRRNPRALILMDCAQCFDASWNGDVLAVQGDAAILAFGIGKPMTTLFGGALLTNREDLAKAVRSYRDTHFQKPSKGIWMRQWFYFLASWIALSRALVKSLDWLENAQTPLRNYLVKLRSREAIRFPGDAQTQMTTIQGAIGRSQLRRVANFIRRRQEIGKLYNQELSSTFGLDILKWPPGSSYGIYALRLHHPDLRPKVLSKLRKAGIQADNVLNYVVPALACYQELGFTPDAYPNATAWSQRVINLPNHPAMTSKQTTFVIHTLRSIMGEIST